MPEITHAGFYEQAAQRMVDDIGLLLVTLSHPSIETVRIVSDTRDCIHNGETFVGWPCLVKIPSVGRDPRRGQLVIQDVDPQIARTLLALPPGMKIALLLEYVLREDTDDVIDAQDGLYFTNLSGNDVLVSGEVVGHGADDAPYPARRSTPENTPGAFVL